MILLLIVVLKRNELIVKAESVRYRKILCLNEEQNFHNISSECYKFTSKCKSKKSFDKLNLDDYMRYIIEKNEHNIANIINKIEDNNYMYDAYCFDLRSIKSVVTQEQMQEFKMTEKGFKRIEDKVCTSVKLNPRLKINIYLSANYISPKGKKRYEKHREYNYDKIKILYYKVMRNKEIREAFEEQKKKERMKMTDSLRYDILKRDHYRCQICGVTAKEGAKLHVDHIKPIAKGGKTVPENLQTLCDRCNLGKSDKY